MKNWTIVIKTFERKNMLTKLLKSVEKYFPDIPVIIVDDSKNNYSKYILNKFKNLNIEYITEDFDIGLSKGRNILINKVKTKYFLLCDDDFEFDERSIIEDNIKLVEENNIDILGGNVYNRISLDSIYSILWILKDIRRLKKVLNGEEFCSIYNGEYEIDNNKIRLNINRDTSKYKDNKIYKTDICSNFFIGRTKKIKEIGGWTPELLKVGEHEFFFLKAKRNNLKVYYTPSFGVRHYPKKTFKYMKFRMKAESYFKEACKLENLDKFEVFDTNKDKTIYSYYK